ncbi:MAG: NAD(P)/FAD-dependent oxidoreductase [Cytophagales bacterium]|nr:NAD(P)/FAD-dependent oxidoreductase [Cytophagales bacterium]
METIVIIGNGISGVTAARYIRKYSDKRIILISAETKYFFSRTALMYIYMGHMKFEHTQPYENGFWEKNRIELVQDYVTSINYETQELSLQEGSPIKYDKLVLAVGSKPNKFGWPGQDLGGVQGLYSAQDLEELEKNTADGSTKRAVIVGGGLIGIEMAEMLLSRKIPVTFLVREGLFWGNVLPKQEAELISRHVREHHVDLRLSTELKEILPDENGRVSKIITGDGEEIECQLVGLTAGVGPNIDFLRDSDLELQRGIMVNQYLETNQKNVYAIGDCAQFDEPVPGRRPMEQVWYTGKIMGETVANTICGNRTKYNPGHWYNSAKFFDIEYQTYGWVFAQLREGETDFYWEHKGGKICMHFVFDKASRKFLGVNTFGVRLRHHAFNTWLTEERTIDHVLEHLKDANFDPEFYAQYEKEIVAKFNKEQGTNILVKKASWDRILNFLKA